jgi:excisionase family DNA binding protein
MKTKKEHPAGEFLHLTVQTLYNKVSKNEIPFMKRGKRLYFSKEQLIDYLKQGSNEMQSDIDIEVNEFLSNKKGGAR